MPNIQDAMWSLAETGASSVTVYNVDAVVQISSFTNFPPWKKHGTGAHAEFSARAAPAQLVTPQYLRYSYNAASMHCKYAICST